MKRRKSYPLDSSAIIHLVSKSRGHSNTFRVTLSLKDSVCPKNLQKALDRVTPRLPCVIAGIRAGFLRYRLEPVRETPLIRPDALCLAPMRRDEIRTCAVRFLYRDNQITAEFFHALTDGYGGMVVLFTLTAAYLELRYGRAIPVSEMTLDSSAAPPAAEIIDDYLTYAGERPRLPSREISYQLPGRAEKSGLTLNDGRLYPADEVSAAARRYGVSVTAFLSAVMAASVLEIRRANGKNSRGEKSRAVQIMIPVNLRRLFESGTLRNFTLFALLRAAPSGREWSFEELTGLCQTQIKEQNRADYMASVMAGSKKAAEFPLFRILPLPVKVLLLRVVHSLFGERASCVSLSNLGVIRLPEEMRENVAGIDFLLTPRIKSPYNCGVVTYNGVLSINFTRSCGEPELETVFFSILEEILKSNPRGDTYDRTVQPRGGKKR